MPVGPMVSALSLVLPINAFNFHRDYIFITGNTVRLLDFWIETKGYLSTLDASFVSFSFVSL